MQQTRPSTMLLSLAVLTLSVTATSVAVAQGPGITTPGMPGSGDYGQSDRFSNEFNPAISLAIDLVGDWLDPEEEGDDDGTSFDARRLDLMFASWIDSNTWAYATVAWEDDELELDEVAIHYQGLPGHHVLRGGRFFVDFGKQMQAHVEELPTLERPLVLREYLGEELAGEGLQWDWWHSAGDKTVMRYSFGAFMGLAGGHGHEHEEASDEGTELLIADRLEIDELNYTARATAFTELGKQSTLQAGLSLREIPSFGYSVDGVELQDLSSSLYGFDLTWGWHDPTNTRHFTLGGEVLQNTGDLAVETRDGAFQELRSIDDTIEGFYLWSELRFRRYQSAGVQFSRAELPRLGLPRESELDVFYTRNLSDFLRLRASVTLIDGRSDATRVAFQVVGFIGPHGHGINW